MALALNNLKRVDMPLNKETKPTIKETEKIIQYLSLAWEHFLNAVEHERDSEINL